MESGVGSPSPKPTPRRESASNSHHFVDLDVVEYTGAGRGPRTACTRAEVTSVRGESPQLTGCHVVQCSCVVGSSWE